MGLRKVGACWVPSAHCGEEPPSTQFSAPNSELHPQSWGPEGDLEAENNDGPQGPAPEPSGVCDWASPSLMASWLLLAQGVKGDIVP